MNEIFKKYTIIPGDRVVLRLVGALGKKVHQVEKVYRTNPKAYKTLCGLTLRKGALKKTKGKKDLTCQKCEEELRRRDGEGNV